MADVIDVADVAVYRMESIKIIYCNTQHCTATGYVRMLSSVLFAHKNNGTNSFLALRQIHCTLIVGNKVNFG